MPDIRNRRVKFKPRDVELATKILSGVPVSRAKREVGITGTATTLTKNQTNTVEAMREHMQQRPGHSFQDTANYLKDASLNKGKRTMPQLYARGMHSKIMGYDAPQKVEVHERREISQAVMVLHGLAEKTGLTPAELFKRMGGNGNVAVQEKDPKEGAVVLQGAPGGGA